jgi:hypothetical protein
MTNTETVIDQFNAAFRERAPENSAGGSPARRTTEA